MDRIFDVENVILTRVTEDDLRSFLIDSDIDDEGNSIFRFPEFSSAIIDTIPEYVFADYLGSDIPLNKYRRRLKEAATSIYKIEGYELMRKACLLNDTSAQSKLDTMSYQKRGEFGELLLHLLLRDFHGTIPLISKAYFKDSIGVPAHGFDAVHISPTEKILWLGESKLYSDSKVGIRALIKDIKEHFRKDYLNEQIAIIKKNLECNKIPQRDEWITNLNNATKLSEQISMINIPLLCTYPHDIYSRYSDMTCDEAIRYHETDVRGLKTFFDTHNDHKLKDKLNIILMLLPIDDKNELVKMLHTKLWHMQNM